MPLSEPSSLFPREHAACQRYSSAPPVRKALTRSTNIAGALVSPCILASDALRSKHLFGDRFLHEKPNLRPVPLVC